MKTLKLERVGENFWGNIVYKGEDEKFYLDISMNPEKVPTELHTCHPADDMDGEPGSCVTSTFEIINPITDKERRENECKGLYMMLSRIYQDVRGFLGLSLQKRKIRSGGKISGGNYCGTQKKMECYSK